MEPDMKTVRRYFIFEYLLIIMCHNFVSSLIDTHTNYLNESVVETMATVHSRYCGRKPDCYGSQFYQQEQLVSNLSNKICCDWCSCDMYTCINYTNIGEVNCCPEVLNQLGNVYETSRCVHPQLLKPWRPNITLESAIVMRDKCDPFANTIEMIDKCEHSSNYTDLDTQVPVSIIYTDHVVTYRNRYCAYCNFYDDVHLAYWRPKIDCYQGTFDITVTPLEQTVEVVRKSKDCKLYFIPPENAHSSDIQQCGGHYLSECNVTGLWREYDPVIATACSAYYSPFQNAYRNIFCYICNSLDNYEENLPVCTRHDNAFVSFSLVLKFIPSGGQELDQETSEVECNNAGIYDPVQDKCLAVKCLFSQVYVDGECQQVAEKIGGFQYNVFLKVTPLERIVYDEDIATAFESFFKYLFRTTGLQPFIWNLQVSCRKSSDVQPINNIVVTYCSIYFLLIFEPSYYEDRLISFLPVKWLLEQHGSNISVNVSLAEFVLCTVQFDIDNYSNDTGNSTIQIEHSLPTLMPIVFCPVVELNTSFYTVTYTTIGVFIKEYDTEIERGEYTKTDSSIFVCTETFELLIEKKSFKEKQIDNEIISILPYTPQGILSLICTSFSIVCSLITLIVYVRLRSIRSQPGINNISLVLSLICAQTFFQFGIGQSANIPAYICSLIGGLIHYFWLVTIFWMNVCSYHMFRIFYHLRIVDHNQKVLRTTCLYWFYCLFAALLPLLINVVVTYSTSGVTGYGGKLCYISEYKMVGYCFSLPVAVVIVTNLSMFLITIRKISSQPEVNKERREEKKYLLIYAKMSTLTGVTWTFGFLYFFTQVSVFEYIFIILNAGQGVFLFLSFVCNQRVLRLLRKPDGNSANFLQTN